MRAALIIALFAFAASASAADKPSSTRDKISYTIGFQIAQDLKRNKFDLNAKQLTQAIIDTLNNQPPQLTPQEMQEAMMTLRTQQQQAMAKVGEENKKAGDEFLAKNRSASGVKETATGLQYKVIKAGTGKKPTASDTVVVHYRGTLVNGTEFDSSYGRGQPATFPVNGVIKGWQEALQLMSKGAKYMVYIPSNLAYGQRGAGPQIGPNSTLIFEVELVDIK
ncbi:MAG: FKBP-type peptidyl-prolyl cis-trans isomerase [Gammaproteobacteria bacterium]|nr:FKBP-type peptidyl-prolyl cis-trans isomerase [Gammaproteobacteria bacterium]